MFTDFEAGGLQTLGSWLAPGLDLEPTLVGCGQVGGGGGDVHQSGAKFCTSVASIIDLY